VKKGNVAGSACHGADSGLDLFFFLFALYSVSNE
jgi:hypothetical protein